MIRNLEKYFKTEHQFYLESIKYAKLELITEPAEEVVLNCSDTISASVNDKKGVRVLVTRKLQFEPKNMFDLEVCFGADLTFEELLVDEIEWEKVNLAEEFKANGGFVLSNLMNRITLLIAQITSSFGQTPLVLPPAIAPKNE